SPRRDAHADVAVQPAAEPRFSVGRDPARGAACRIGLCQIDREALRASGIESRSIGFSAGGGLPGEAGAAGFGDRRAQGEPRDESLQRLFAEPTCLALSREADDLTGMAGKCETELS